MKKRILCLVLALLLVFSIIPPQTFAADVEVNSEGETFKEREAKIISSFPVLWKDPTNNDPALQLSPLGGELPTVVKVVDVYHYSEMLTLYKLDAVDGDTWPEAYKEHRWMESTKLSISCDKCGEYDCTLGHENWCEICQKDDCGINHGATEPTDPSKPEDTCDCCENCTGAEGCECDCEDCDFCGKEQGEICLICGEINCTKLHFYCEKCEDYDCGKGHLYCLACGEMDCTENHVFCGTCGKYDCGQTHEDVYKPATAPAIPQNPTLTPGAEVSVVDEYGDSVADGLTLIAGTKTSISAWPNAGTGASYQWQVRVDGKWIDIQGQNRQGLLISPAMVLSAMSGDEAQVRCQVTVDGETKTSAAIPVSVVVPESMATFARTASGAAAAKAAAPTAEEDENKVNVIIHYVFTNNAIAANPWAATLPKGVAYSTTTPITVPVIAGYAPSLGDGVDPAKVALSADGNLSLNFTAEDLAADQTINIVYQPAPVKVVVNHHWQNVADDNYTLHETVETTAVTGTKLGDVHKSYEGFYSLLYEHPTVAADGSTVVDVYYDRYYYLMTFDLSGGYGMDAIYARYGSPIPLATMGEPTRPGYTLTGWTLDGRDAAVMSTMPARNTTFVAVWSGEMTSYDVVFWYENADNSRYSQAGVLEDVDILAGSVVNGADHKDYAFKGRDDEHFTYFRADENVTINGDGSTVINVYFKRNLYTVTFVMGDTANGCTVPLHASHTDYTGECYTLTCDQYHVHTDDCNSTITCGKEAHTHTDACLICTKPIHPGHTVVDCYELNCDKTSHNHVTDGCTLNCNHTVHSLACYGNPSTSDNVSDNDLAAIANIPGTDDPQSGYVYAIKVSYDYRTYYYFYFNGQWYAGDDVTRGDTVGTGTYQSSGLVSRTWTATKYVAVCSHTHSDSCYTCGKTQGTHTHTIEGGCYNQTCNLEIHAAHTEADGCYKDTAHTHTDDCYTYSCGVSAHTHTEACYKLTCDHLHYHRGDTCYLVITRKYDAVLSDVWTEDPVKSVLADGYVFQSSITDAYYSFLEKVPGQDVTMTKASFNGNTTYKWYYYLEVLPNVDYSGKTVKTYDGKTYYLDHPTSLKAGDLYLTYDEDYYPLTGFTQLYAKGEGGWYQNGKSYRLNFDNNNEAFLYYTRNQYNLSFSNHGTVVAGKGGDFYYQADISGQYFVPDYPSTLEPDVYRFEGWYTSPFFGNTKYEFTTTDEDGNVVKATMPAEAIRLYAHWVPVSRTVRFYLDKADMDAGVTIPQRMDALWKETHNGQSNPNSPYVKFNTKTDVPNKSFLSEIDTPGVSDGYDNHPYKGFTFVGWFYMDNGVEKAFDPKNMPVTQDMDLYGKWSSNVLCPYEIRFVLDENGNGVLDAGETTFVADPITGSTLAGNSRTFNAKGDTALYADYQSGYYPNVASHTIDFKASDESGVVYTFLYKPGDPVPYTVKYLEKGTNKELATEVTHPKNTKAVVTENFKPIPGYMPDAFQKTLVVVPGSDENVIIFWYTKDEQHAPYQVNHYVQTLDGTGWIEYRSADFTGDIGKVYSADAITITGFTFSTENTNDFNTTKKINGYDGSKLPGEVSFDGADTVSGKLTGNGMQLNLYYTRNTHTYKVQYLEYGTGEVLEEEKVVTNVFYGTIVTENAITIRRDMDGDGLFDDFQLYEATAPSQNATITDDSKVFVFYYVRCTGEELSVTKALTGNPSEDISFNFTLTSTATDFAEISNGTYAYEIKSGTTSVEKGYKTVTNGKTITFSLKAGQTITFFGMPTAVYTVTEHKLPLGYYETSAKNQKVTLTKDAKVKITVTNEYAPAALEVTKKVNRIENVTDNVTDFVFYITVPSGVTGTYSYTVGAASRNVTVADGKMTITLQDGETALFANLPAGVYTVAERDYTSEGYSAVYVDTDDTASDGKVTLSKGQKDSVLCTNAYPVGSLTITKTVAKAYANDEWTGDTFTFTIERTDGELKNDSYPVLSGTTKIGDAKVNADGNLVVEIAFTELGAKTIKIDNLPKGNYRVTEAENTEYTQSARTVTTSISPEDYAGKAEFTNTYKKHLGDLTITKNVTALDGYTAPEDAVFTFKVGGTSLRKSSYLVIISDSKGEVGRADCSTINGSLSLSLKGGQTAVIKDLALDYYNVTEQADARFIMTSSSGTNGSINAEDTAKAEFTNTYVPRGSLQVAKFIDSGVYQHIQIDTEQEFTFTVTLNYPLDRQETYTAKIYTVGAAEPDKTTSLTGKTLTFKLKHNQYIVIEDLPTVAYTIEEAAVEGYLTPNFMGNESGVIIAGGATEVICYNPVELVPGDLQITKIINDTTYNSSAPRDLPFEFTVTLNYITEPKNADGVYRVEYTCDPSKGTLVEVKTDGVVTGYLYTPNGGKEDALPATITVEPGMDMEHGFVLELYDGMTATVKDLPPSAYHVVEKDYSADGFAASWTGNERGLLGGALVNGKNPVEILTCTNVYPVNKNGEVIIRKQVTKDYIRDVLPADTFKFKVTPTDGNILEGDYKVTISGVNVETVATTTTATAIADANGTYLLVEIPFTAAELVMELNDSRTKTLVIAGLPLGQYEVEETEDDDYRQTPEDFKQSVYVGTNPGDATFINRYKRHLGNIQITKDLAEGSVDDGSEFLFHILDSNGNEVMSVTLKAGETKTIWDLPIGVYTVREDTSWNWRFTLTSDNDVQADLNRYETASVTFVNAFNTPQWLNFVIEMLNRFTASNRSDTNN